MYTFKIGERHTLVINTHHFLKFLDAPKKKEVLNEVQK